MGQATVDLPDPLEQPPPASGANTDELLAQLAGEEIDRLLAEADSAAPSAAAAAVAAPVSAAREKGPATPPPAPSTPTVETQKIEVVAKVALGDVPSAPPAVSIPKPLETDTAVEAAVSAQLDELFQQLTGGDTGKAAAPAVPAAPAAVEDVSAAAREADQAISAAAPAALTALEAELEAAAPAGSADASAPAEPVDPNASTSVAERAVLDAVGAPPASAEDAEVDAILEIKALPFYLKPLEWLNAPLESCPDAIRDVIGKIAILTTFNAVALLLYVLLFRKH